MGMLRRSIERFGPDDRAAANQLCLLQTVDRLQVET